MPADHDGSAAVDPHLLIAQLDAEELREILDAAVDQHDDVADAVRLTASRAASSLASLRGVIDRSLRANGFVDYHGSRGWARQAAPVLAEISRLVAYSPSAELVGLIERALGHVIGVILHSDDSDGAIGDVASELLDLHAQSCDAGVADPAQLARWMVRFGLEDQDFFIIDPVRYSTALGKPASPSTARRSSAVSTPETTRSLFGRPPSDLPCSMGTWTASWNCWAGISARPINSFASPRSWRSWDVTTTSSPGRIAASRRQPDGKSPSSTTSPRTSVDEGARRMKYSPFDVLSTARCRPRRPTPYSATYQRPRALGVRIASPPGRRSRATTSAA